MSITCSLMRQCVVNVVKSSNFQTITSTHTYPSGALFRGEKKNINIIHNMHGVNLCAEYRTSSREVVKPNRRQRQRYQNVFFIFGEARSTTELLFAVRGSVLLLFPSTTRNDEIKRANLHVI